MAGYSPPPTGEGSCAPGSEKATEPPLPVGGKSFLGQPGERLERPFGFAPLYRAYLACRRGKRGTRKAQRYEMRLLDHLVETAQALQEESWRPSRAIRFVVTHPKPREILAAEFADRVVHHLLVPWLERHYEPVFIHDSFANRKGKGSHAAVDRLQAFTRAMPAAWYLQLDIGNFFNSINRRVLFGLLRHRLERDARRPADDVRHAPPAEARAMLGLARRLLTGNPARRAVYQGRPEDLARVPAHKQLANAPAETGLPIGNLTSQFFANVYLNELDQFVKHRLKARHYVRYVDDFVLLHPDRAQLEAWRQAIAGFLRERLGLALRDAGRLAPIGNGIDFLGYIARPDYRLVRRRVLGHARERLARHGRRCLRRGGELFLPPGRADAVQATLASYLGHFRHAQAGGAVSRLFAGQPWLGHLLDCREGDRDRLRRVDRPAGVTSLASQWRYFRRRYPGHVVMMQVGNRWECQAPEGDELPLAFRRAPGHRPGLPATSCLAFGQLATLKRALTRQGRPWCEVAENGHLRGA